MLRSNLPKEETIICKEFCRAGFDAVGEIVDESQEKQRSKNSTLGDSGDYINRGRDGVFQCYLLLTMAKEGGNPLECVTSHTVKIQFGKQASVGDFVKRFRKVQQNDVNLVSLGGLLGNLMDGQDELGLA